MSQIQFERKWIEQCAAARRVKEKLPASITQPHAESYR
jgi:hypothetical protein